MTFGRTMIVGAVFVAAMAVQGQAQAAQRLVTRSGAWRAIAADQGGKRLCFVISSPTARLPADLRRDPGSLFVTLKPRGQGVATEMSIQFGFRLDPAGNVAAIDGRRFPLTVRGETAWLAAEADEPAAVQAMRAGRELRVAARSARGNATTDVYDLGGFSAALDALVRACRR